MTRSILALATVIFASIPLFTPGAQACISCNYTPEVVNTPNPNAAKRNKARTNQAKKQRSPAAKRKTVRKTPPAAPATQAKAKPAPAAPAPKETVAKSKPVPAETGPTQSGPGLTGSSALMQHSIPKQPEPVAAAEAEGACKRFIPAVGATVSVACD